MSFPWVGATSWNPSWDPTWNSAYGSAPSGLLDSEQPDQLDPSQIPDLSSGDILGMTTDQISSLSLDEVAQFTPSQLATFRPDQMSGFSAGGFAVMDQDQIASFSALQISGITASAIAGLNVAGLDPSQLTDITAAQAAGLTSTQLSSLTDAQLDSLSPSALSGLTSDQIGSLSADQLDSLSADQLQALGDLSQADVTDMDSAQLALLTPTQIGTLTTQQVDALTSELTPEQYGGLTSTQTSGFSLTQTDELTGDEMGEFSADGLSGINPGAFIYMTPAQIAGISAQDAPGLTAGELSYIGYYGHGYGYGDETDLSASAVAAFTPDQVTSFSDSEIAALGPTQIAAVGTVLLQALSTDQIASISSYGQSGFTPDQIAALSPDQVGAFWHIDGITPDTLSALDPSIVAQFSPSAISYVTVDQFAAMTPDQFAALTSSQTAGLSVYQTDALTPQQMGEFSADGLSGIAPGAFQYMSSAQIAGISAQDAPGLTSGQLSYIGYWGHPSGYGDPTDLASSAVAAFTPDQLASFTDNEINAFGPTQIAALGADQLQALSTDQIASISSYGQSGLTSDQIAALSPDQIGAFWHIDGVTPDTLAALDPSIVSQFSAPAISYLSVDQFAAMTPDQFAALTSSQTAGLSIYQTDDLTPDQMGEFSADGLSGIAPGAFRYMSPGQIAGISAQDTPGLTAGELSYIGYYGHGYGYGDETDLSASAVAAFTPDQVTSFSDSEIAALGPTQIAAVGTVLLQALSTDQIASISSYGQSGFTPDQIAALSPDQVGAFWHIDGITPDTLSALDPSIVAQFSPSAISYVTVDQFAAMTPDQFAALTSSQTAGLSVYQTDALTPQQMGEFSADGLSGIAPGAFQYMSSAQIAGISAQDAPGLTSGQLSYIGYYGHAYGYGDETDLSASAVAAFTPDQITSFSDSEINAFGPTQIAALGADQLQALSTDQIASISSYGQSGLTSDQIAALSPDQIGAFWHIDGVTPDTLAALDPSIVSQFSAPAISYLSVDQFAAMTPDQFAALTSSQTAGLSIYQTDDLTPDQMGEFSADGLSGIAPGAFRYMSPGQIAGISAQDAPGLTSDQLAYIGYYGHPYGYGDLTDLNPEAAAALSDANITDQDMSEFSPEEIASLATSQLQGLTSDQIASISTWGQTGFSPAQLQTFSSDQLASFDTIAGITTDTLSALDPSTVAEFSPTAISTLSGDQITALTDDQLFALTPSQTAALTFQEVSSLSPEQMGAFSSDGLSAVNSGFFPYLSPEQLAGISAQDAPGLTAAQLQAIGAGQPWWNYTDGVWGTIQSLSDVAMGSLSADQLGSFSDANVASLTADQIQAISTSAILGFTPEQIDDFSGPQIAAFTDMQVGAFTPNQVGALEASQIPSLSTVQITAITPSAITALSVPALQALSQDQLAAVTPDQIAALTATQLQGLTDDEVSTLSTTQTSALSGAQLQALLPDQLQSVGDLNIEKLTLSQVQDFTPDMIATLTSDQVTSLGGEEVEALNASQIGALSASDISSINESAMTALGSTQIGDLTTDQVGAITDEQMAVLHPNQATALLSGFAASLTPDQLGAISSSTLSALDPSLIASLSDDQLGGLQVSQASSLTASQVAALSSDQVNSLAPDVLASLSPAALATTGNAVATMLNPQLIQTLTSDQVGALTPDQIAALDSEQIASLAPDTIGSLTADQITALGSNLLALDPNEFASISSDQATGLTTDQVAALDPMQFANFQTTTIAGLNGDQLSSLTIAQLAALDPDQVAAIPSVSSLVTDVLQSMDTTQAGALTATQLSQLAGDAINNLTPVQFASLNGSQVSSLSNAQLAALDDHNVANLQADALSALSAGQLQAFSEDQLNALSSPQLAGLTPGQIRDLTPTQLASLQPTLIRSMSTAQIQALTTQQLAALTPDQIADLKSNLDLEQNPNDAAVVDLTAQEVSDLSATQIQAFTPAEIASLSTTQLQALSPTQLQSLLPIELQSLTTSQLSTLSSAQMNAIVTPLAELGIETVGAGVAPYQGSDSVQDGGAIVDGDETQVSGLNYIVVDNPDGSQSLIPSTSSTLPDGSFEASIVGGTQPSSSSPTAGITPVTIPGSASLPSNEIYLQGTPFANLVAPLDTNTNYGTGWYRATDPDDPYFEISYHPSTNQWDFSDPYTGQGVWAAGLGNSTSRSTYAGVYALYQNHFGNAPASSLPSNQIYINGTPFGALLATATSDGWYYATDPNDSNFEIGYNTQTLAWDFTNTATGNGVSDQDASSYDAAYQAYQGAYGDAPLEYPTVSYVPVGVTVGSTDGTNSYQNAAPSGSILGNTGIWSDPGDSSSFAPVNGSQAALVGTTGSVSQTLNNLTAGQWYAISFSAMTSAIQEAADTSWEGTVSLGTVASAPQSIKVTLDGQDLGVFTTSQLSDLSSEASSYWQEFATAAFVGSAGQHTLTIQGLDSNGDPTASLTLDNLQLLQVTPVGTVSEPPGGISSLSAIEITNSVTGLQLVADNDSDLQSLDADQLQAITPQALEYMWGAAINRFTPTQLPWMTTEQVAALLPDQISYLGSVLNDFSTQQLQALSTLSSLTTQDIRDLTPATFSQFTASQDATLTRLQLAALNPSQLEALDSGVWSLFNATQVSGFSAFQLSAVPESSLVQLSSQAIVGLPDIESGMSIQDWLNAPSTTLPTGVVPSSTNESLGLALTLYNDDTPGATASLPDTFLDTSLAAGQVEYDDPNTAASFSGAAGITANDSSLSNGNDAPPGLDAAFIQGVGSLTETITGLTPGEDYEVALNAAQSSENSGNEALTVLVDGTVVSTFVPGTSYGPDVTDSFAINSSGPHTITIQGSSTSFTASGTALIDDMQISLANQDEVLSGGTTLQDGNFAVGSTTPFASPWSFTGAAGLVSYDDPSAYPAPSGPVDEAYLSTNGTISQVVGGFEAGKTYTVAFDVSALDPSVQQGVRVAIDGTELDAVTATSSDFTLQYTATFTATAGTHEISFTGIGPSGDGDSVDITDVRILATGDASEGAAIDDGSFQDSTSPWTFNGTSGTESDSTSQPVSPVGDSEAYLSGTASFDQEVSGFQAASNYVLSFRAAQDAGDNQTFDVLVDGTVVGTFTPGSQYQTFTTSVFDPGPGPHRVTFQGLSSSDTALIDDVELVMLPASPISTSGDDTTIDHIPSQDEIQRLQWASLVATAESDSASQDGGDDMGEFAPDMDGISAIDGPLSGSAQLGWASGATSTVSTTISSDNATVTQTITSTDGSQEQVQWSGNENAPSDSSTVIETLIAAANVATSWNSALPVSSTLAPDVTSSPRSTTSFSAIGASRQFLTPPQTITSTYIGSNLSDEGAFATFLNNIPDPEAQDLIYVGGSPFSGAARQVSIGANGAMWAIGTDAVNGGYGVYDYTIGNWNEISGVGAVNISVDSQGDPWIVNDSSQIFHWQNGSFVQMPGLALQVAAGANGDVWAISNSDSLDVTQTPTGGGNDAIDQAVMKWTGSGWQQVDAQGVQIAVDSSGNPWIVDQNNDISTWNGSTFVSVLGSASYLATGADGSVWKLDASDTPLGGRQLSKWDPTTETWTTAASLPAQNLAIDASGQPWIVEPDGTIYQPDDGFDQSIEWMNLPGTWKQVIAAPDGTLYALSTDTDQNGASQLYKYDGTEWEADGTQAYTQISMQYNGGAGVLWGLGTSGVGPIGGTAIKMPSPSSGGGRLSSQDTTIPVQFAVAGDGTIWALSPGTGSDGNLIYRFDPTLKNWQIVPGSAVQIAVGQDGDPWIVNNQDQIFHWNDTEGFVQMPGEAISISVGPGGQVWSVAPPGEETPQSLGPDDSSSSTSQVVQIWDQQFNGWQYANAPSGTPATVTVDANNNVVVVNQDGTTVYGVDEGGYTSPGLQTNYPNLPYPSYSMQAESNLFDTVFNGANFSMFLEEHDVPENGLNGNTNIAGGLHYFLTFSSDAGSFTISFEPSNGANIFNFGNLVEVVNADAKFINSSPVRIPLPALPEFANESNNLAMRDTGIVVLQTLLSYKDNLKYQVVPDTDSTIPNAGFDSSGGLVGGLSKAGFSSDTISSLVSMMRSNPYLPVSAGPTGITRVVAGNEFASQYPLIPFKDRVLSARLNQLFPSPLQQYGYGELGGGSPPAPITATGVDLPWIFTPSSWGGPSLPMTQGPVFASGSFYVNTVSVGDGSYNKLDTPIYNSYWNTWTDQSGRFWPTDSLGSPLDASGNPIQVLYDSNGNPYVVGPQSSNVPANLEQPGQQSWNNSPDDSIDSELENYTLANVQVLAYEETGYISDIGPGVNPGADGSSPGFGADQGNPYYVISPPASDGGDMGGEGGGSGVGGGDSGGDFGGDYGGGDDGNTGGP